MSVEMVYSDDLVTLWCGDGREWMAERDDFEDAGWKLGQEVVWEKHNGSGFHADRFKRVHEIAVHWYRGEWASLHHETPTTPDATARELGRKAEGCEINPAYCEAAIQRLSQMEMAA